MIAEQKKTFMFALITGIASVLLTIALEHTQAFDVWAYLHIHIWWVLMMIGVPDPYFKYLFLVMVFGQWFFVGAGAWWVVRAKLSKRKINE